MINSKERLIIIPTILLGLIPCSLKKFAIWLAFLFNSAKVSDFPLDTRALLFGVFCTCSSNKVCGSSGVL